MDTQLVPTQDPYSEMERMDEQQVLDEIKGRAIESLVYEIQQGRDTVTGLSLAGVREVARSMNSKGNSRIGITDREPIITETEDFFEVKIYAQDTQNGGGYWGIKRQPKKYNNGSVNQFALEQALAKAQRNALRGLIPEWFAKEMIDAYRSGNKGIKRIGGNRPAQDTAGKKWNDRADLIQRVAKEILYYKDPKHILNTLSVLEKDGKITTAESDEVAFNLLNLHANEKANATT